MKRIAVFYVIIPVLCLFIFTTNGFSELTPAQKHKRAAMNKAKRQDDKKYEYIRDHDLNHDGKVDAKERQMAANRVKSAAQPALVSTEDEDMFEIMDIDKSGSVEEDEMEFFYSRYDANNDGTLDKDELKAAVKD